MWFFDNYTGVSPLWDSFVGAVYLFKSARYRGELRIRERDALHRMQKAGLGEVRLRIDGESYHGEPR